MNQDGLQITILADHSHMQTRNCSILCTAGDTLLHILMHSCLQLNLSDSKKKNVACANATEHFLFYFLCFTLPKDAMSQFVPGCVTYFH